MGIVSTLSDAGQTEQPIAGANPCFKLKICSVLKICSFLVSNEEIKAYVRTKNHFDKIQLGGAKWP